MYKITRYYEEVIAIRESVFQTKVMGMLEKLPHCWAFKTVVSNQRGICDVIGVINGKFFALELKTEIGRPSKIQQYIISKINKAGGYATIVRPSTWEAILKELKEL